jgi:hypothetical protein
MSLFLARRLLRVLLKRVCGVGAQVVLLVVTGLLGILARCGRTALLVDVGRLRALLCVGLVLGLGRLAALLGCRHFYGLERRVRLETDRKYACEEANFEWAGSGFGGSAYVVWCGVV